MSFTPRRGGGLYEPLADINVTPFVDVMLVLLIVFMITAPMLAAGMRVDLPQAKTAQPLDPKEPVIITVGKDKTLFVGRDETTRGGLVRAVRAKLAVDTNRPIYVRGDLRELEVDAGGVHHRRGDHEDDEQDEHDVDERRHVDLRVQLVAASALHRHTVIPVARSPEEVTLMMFR